MSQTAPDRPPQPAPPTPGTRRPTRTTAAAVGAGVALVALVVALVLGTRGPDDAGTTPDPAAAPTSTARSTAPAEPTDPAPTAASPDASAPADPSSAPPAAVGPPATAAPDDGAVAAPPEPEALPSLAPVPLEEEADFGTEVVAQLTDIVRVDGEGSGPGEGRGPALAVTIQMTNGTGSPIDLDFVVVDIMDAAGDVGQVLFGDARAAPFRGPLPPGGTSTGTYVLLLPDPATTGVTVTLSYGAEAPTAVFSGPVPGSPPGG